MKLKILQSDDVRFTPESKDDTKTLATLKGKTLIFTGKYAAIKTW